jgi:hypothetical protein
MKPMSDDMMRQLPQFKKLLDYLVETGNEKVVLAVCNGAPQLLEKLNRMVDSADKKDKDAIVRDFVIGELINVPGSIYHLVERYPKINEV